MNWEVLIRGLEFLLGSGVLAVLWKANRLLNRLWDVIQEYPPHRHVGHAILYPRGMSPEEVESLKFSR